MRNYSAAASHKNRSKMITLMSKLHNLLGHRARARQAKILEAALHKLVALLIELRRSSNVRAEDTSAAFNSGHRADACELQVYGVVNLAPNDAARLLLSMSGTRTLGHSAAPRTCSHNAEA